MATENKKKFDHLFEMNQNRFREQVVVAVRSAEMADLTDPSLGLIKRTILERQDRSSASPFCRK